MCTFEALLHCSAEHWLFWSIYQLAPHCARWLSFTCKRKRLSPTATEFTSSRYCERCSRRCFFASTNNWSLISKKRFSECYSYSRHVLSDWRGTRYPSFLHDATSWTRSVVHANFQLSRTRCHCDNFVAERLSRGSNLDVVREKAWANGIVELENVPNWLIPTFW